MALTDKLTSIANAIREKGGTTEKLTLDAMPNAIAALPTGGGSEEDGVPNPITYTGNISHIFKNNNNSWVINNFFDRLVFEGVSSVENTFADSTTIKKLPSLKQSASYTTWLYTFSGMTNLEEVGDIINFYPSQCSRIFQNCYRLRNCPRFVNPKEFNTGSTGYNNGYMFSYCYSLRNVDEELMKSIQSKSSSSSYSPYYSCFTYCCSLDEIKSINPITATTLTSNVFSSTFNYCCRLKRITFNLQDDGSPFVVKWKGQTIDLSKYTGWAGASNSDKNILNYNSGITAEDEDNDWSNNPNYWSRQFMNSRFNHDSAVEFINSLPDTSAYVAEQNAANNTIKFYTNAGSATPGGGVSDLTEEEIAVAAAKGWTISYTTG